MPGQFLSFMEKQGIVPRQVLEAEKRKIRQALTSQKSFKSEGEAKEQPDFFRDLEEKFINKCVEMGYEYTQVKHFIEDKGLAEYSFDLFADNFGEPTYNNTLFKPAAADSRINSSKFEYYDPGVHQKPIGKQLGVQQ